MMELYDSKCNLSRRPPIQFAMAASRILTTLIFATMLICGDHCDNALELVPANYYWGSLAQKGMCVKTRDSGGTASAQLTGAGCRSISRFEQRGSVDSHHAGSTI
jgi:hypothetical protein